MGQSLGRMCNQNNDSPRANKKMMKRLASKDEFMHVNPHASKTNLKSSQSSDLDELDDSSEDGPHPLSLWDFDIIRCLGEGSFGQVALVRKKDTRKIFALKVIKKKNINKISRVEDALTERNILLASKSPFIVKLQYAFQSERCLYYCIDYAAGGELISLIAKRKRLELHHARFYAVEILLALEHLHEELNCIYRDLKPENVLIDSTGHLKLTDFGLSTIGKEKSTSFCGTPAYLAPEIIKESGHTKTVDFWAYGCLVFEMLVGHPPFKTKAKSVKALYSAILEGKYMMPVKIDEDAKSFITDLLVLNPDNRLGNGGISEVKKHSFFKDIDFEAFKNLSVEPPYIPEPSKEDQQLQTEAFPVMTAKEYEKRTLEIMNRSGDVITI